MKPSLPLLTTANTETSQVLPRLCPYKIDTVGRPFFYSRPCFPFSPVKKHVNYVSRLLCKKNQCKTLYFLKYLKHITLQNALLKTTHDNVICPLPDSQLCSDTTLPNKTPV